MFSQPGLGFRVQGLGFYIKSDENVFSLPGVSRGDTVAVIASNTPEMNECYFGIPLTGAVILAINTRLDPAAVAFILEHSEAKFLITDTEVCYIYVQNNM